MIYASLVGGREQLFVRTIAERTTRQLTSDDIDHEDPAWSPDGRWLAFTAVRGESRRIAVMPADGGAPRYLTPDTERAIHPSWSPDGQRLLYCTDDDVAPPKKNVSDVKAIDMASGRIRTLITGGVNTFPVYSPDGTRIAFRRMLGERNSEVFLADSAGHGAINLSNDPAFDGWPSWSPDGRWLAFASNRGPGTAYRIYVMRPDGSDVRLVADTRGRATSPIWSRDGASLYFTNCWRVGDGTDCQVFVASPAFLATTSPEPTGSEGT